MVTGEYMRACIIDVANTRGERCARRIPRAPSGVRSSGVPCHGCVCASANRPPFTMNTAVITGTAVSPEAVRSCWRRSSSSSAREV